MATPPDLPLGLTLLIVLLLLIGSVFTFIGALGLALFQNFYDRLHMPTLGTTIGFANILLATIIYSSYIAGQPVLRDALLLFFVTLAAPISLMMLSRAAAMRDFTKSWRDMSDNMFWQIARAPITDKTDAQVEKDIEREDKQQQAAEERGAKAALKLQTAKKAGGKKAAAADLAMPSPDYAAEKSPMPAAAAAQTAAKQPARTRKAIKKPAATPSKTAKAKPRRQTR